MLNAKDWILDKEVANVYVESQIELRRANSGMWGQVKAKSSRKNPDLMGSKEDRLPNDVVLTVRGIKVVIPGAWYTQRGTLRKAKVEAYKELISKAEVRKQEWLSAVSRSDEALKLKMELGRDLTIEELEAI